MRFRPADKIEDPPLAIQHAISAGLWLIVAVAFILTRSDPLLGALPLLAALLYLGLAWRGPAKPTIALNVFRISTSAALAALVWVEFGPTTVGLLGIATQLVTILIRRRRRSQIADLA
jgi:hypothetical protein